MLSNDLSNENNKKKSKNEFIGKFNENHPFIRGFVFFFLSGIFLIASGFLYPLGKKIVPLEPHLWTNGRTAIMEPCHDLKNYICIIVGIISVYISVIVHNSVCSYLIADDDCIKFEKGLFIKSFGTIYYNTITYYQSTNKGLLCIGYGNSKLRIAGLINYADFERILNSKHINKNPKPIYI